MKTTDKKQAFIIARAENKSYSIIAKELNISKSTCNKWAKELQTDIEVLKSESLAGTKSQYIEATEQRKQALIDTYSQIKNAVKNIDYSEIPPYKLLELFLKYNDAFKEEITNENIKPIKSFKIEDIQNAMLELANRVRAGTVTNTQAEREVSIYKDMLTTYDKTVLQEKQAELEKMLLSLQEQLK